MMNKLSQRDKKAFAFGAAGVAIIVVFYFAMGLLGHWREVRVSLARAKSQMKTLDSYSLKGRALASVVPAFEMPQDYENQMVLFRQKINEQLKKTGITAEPVRLLPISKGSYGGYKLLRMKCSGTGKLGQVFDLLAELKSNPYLAGVDEFKMTCDEKNRQNVKLSLVVTTFVK